MLDGFLISNEIVNHAKKKKIKMFLFKVDFEKAYDSVNWNFLFHTMKQMGFGEKWINWIRVCLKSASTSILINGTPFDEFHMQRGLRQGDPLTLFLFLLLGEVLQLMIRSACNQGLFKGIRLAKSNWNLFLLQFADDALIFGKWSRKNLVTLTNILNCFHEVSGLRINLSKCNLFGIGVSEAEVNNMAAKWVWRFLSSSNAIWKDVISEFYGEGGGLFSNRPLAGNSVWVSIVNTCRNVKVAGQNVIHSFTKQIAKESNSLFWKDASIGQGSKLKDLFPRLYALERDENAVFKDRWTYINGSWCGAWDWKTTIRGRCLDDLLALERQLSQTPFNTSGEDVWSWNWNKKGIFSINHMSKLIQGVVDSNGGSNETCFWSPLIPKKVNIFTWRFLKEAIPVRFNLSKRGIHYSLWSASCVRKVLKQWIIVSFLVRWQAFFGEKFGPGGILKLHVFHRWLILKC
ncbi:uncharacterized protein LOC112524938 [Cynara cardunculus var. scolymus]|uniref:uncharacterized protein LOC112524938 n=1 Tax=Cynara cardunculus var. scolymus TaxID=59895 RepID=UPI000D62FBEE|nr:uncharacterized protein LOC112524938 [Cynara cardunculus var. scolymus]